MKEFFSELHDSLEQWFCDLREIIERLEDLSEGWGDCDMSEIIERLRDFLSEDEDDEDDEDEGGGIV